MSTGDIEKQSKKEGGRNSKLGFVNSRPFRSFLALSLIAGGLTLAERLSFAHSISYDETNGPRVWALGSPLSSAEIPHLKTSMIDRNSALMSENPNLLDGNTMGIRVFTSASQRSAFTSNYGEALESKLQGAEVSFRQIGKAALVPMIPTSEDSANSRLGVWIRDLVLIDSSALSGSNRIGEYNDPQALIDNGVMPYSDLIIPGATQKVNPSNGELEWNLRLILRGISLAGGRLTYTGLGNMNPSQTFNVAADSTFVVPTSLRTIDHRVDPIHRTNDPNTTDSTTYSDVIELPNNTDEEAFGWYHALQWTQRTSAEAHNYARIAYSPRNASPDMPDEIQFKMYKAGVDVTSSVDHTQTKCANSEDDPNSTADTAHAVLNLISGLPTVNRYPSTTLWPVDATQGVNWHNVNLFCKTNLGYFRTSAYRANMVQWLSGGAADLAEMDVYLVDEGQSFTFATNFQNEFRVIQSQSTPTPESSPTLPATSTGTATSTATVTATRTETQTGTPTNTPTITATNSATGTATVTETETSTGTPSETATNTPSPSVTNSPSETPTSTPTASPSETATPPDTSTPTPTLTPSRTPSRTNTPSSTPTNTPVPTSSSGSGSQPGTGSQPGSGSAPGAGTSPVDTGSPAEPIVSPSPAVTPIATPAETPKPVVSLTPEPTKAPTPTVIRRVRVPLVPQKSGVLDLIARLLGR